MEVNAAGPSKGAKRSKERGVTGVGYRISSPDKVSYTK